MEDKEQQPPSPVIGPVQVKECIEEILRFTLTSTIKGEVDVGLSKDYCSRLLQDDLSNPYSSTPEHLNGGVPSYPLYKHVASSLYQSLSSATLVGMPMMKFIMSDEENSSKLKEDEWMTLIMENGSELLNMLKTVDFGLHVQEPFFTQLNDGKKLVEGRCAFGNYNRIAVGDLILFNKCLLLEVQVFICSPELEFSLWCSNNEMLDNLQYVHCYASFREMIEAEGLQKVLPGVAALEEGVQVYRNFYSEEQESLNGVLGICVAKHFAPLHSYMSCILSGLGYVGIQRMLNIGCTGGTIAKALPPPISTLVSSFLEPYNQQAEGSLLTVGARALEKHVNRSSAEYWGNVSGSETDKNRLALNIIGHFIVHCCWLNVHVVPPHGAVFEVRVAEGYGARWSEDGCRFVGFLEPYMVDGHQKGWKH